MIEILMYTCIIIVENVLNKLAMLKIYLPVDLIQKY